jgi:hypothetical protein
MAHWRTMMDNSTMTAGDLLGRGDVTTTIESVKAGSLKVQGGKKKAPLIKFAGFALPLGANATNCNTITRMYGSDTDAWSGKRVTLYVAMVKAPDPDDKAKTIMTEAIRIRPTIPTGGDSTARPEPPPLTEEQAAVVKALCESIDAATTEAKIEEAIAPKRDAIKAIGGRAVATVAAAKTQRIANIQAANAADGDVP